MNLILLHPPDFRGPGKAILADERAQHIRQTLKAAVGKTLRIGLLNGPLGTGMVQAIDGDQVSLQCHWDDTHPPQPQIDVLLAMPRPKVMKRLWAQLAALGVGNIVLVKAEKVERFYFDTHVLQPEFYTARLIEGLQQAGCTHLPQVLLRPRFKPFIEDELNLLFPDHKKILADPAAQKPMAEGGCKTGRMLLAIGPEGGWTNYEKEKLQEYGFDLFGMGPRILRTDTACVALIALLQQHGA